MTRTEQKMVRELDKALKQNLRSASKLYGFKVVQECAYKVIDGFLYEVYVYAPPAKCGTAIKAKISVKPCVIDEIFWEVYQLKEAAQKKPFSFHITAAHVPYPHTIKEIEIPVQSVNKAIEALNEALCLSDTIVERHHSSCMTIDDFKAKIAGTENPTDRLNVVLCEVAEGNYKCALSLAEKELAADRLALFAKATDHGLKGIYEYIKEFCESKIETQVCC